MQNAYLQWEETSAKDPKEHWGTYHSIIGRDKAGYHGSTRDDYDEKVGPEWDCSLYECWWEWRDYDQK
jgi:hypothetical protein